MSSSWNAPHKDSPQRILITGANGQLGSRLVDRFGPSALPVTIDALDLTDDRATRDFVLAARPHAVINTAAYTAVDAAEADATRCVAVNANAVATLAAVTRELGCPLVQISTDYVFAGAPPTPLTPLTEECPVTPRGVYARSKADGEDAARTNPHHMIVRTCGIYGAARTPSAGNFVNTMLRLGKERSEIQVVQDQICCPTWVEPLADAIHYLVTTNQNGTFHVVNPQGVSWFEFAQHVFQYAGITCDVRPISSAQYNAGQQKTVAPRPAYSELSIAKYAAAGGPTMVPCLEALREYIQTLAD